jgi:hypothetical protein
MAEYWYNTSFHSSLQVTTFQALYGFPPPALVVVRHLENEAREFLQ